MRVELQLTSSAGAAGGRGAGGWLVRYGPMLWAVVAPLVGVFALGWDAFQLVLLYWLENVLLGVLAVVRVVRALRRDGAGSVARWEALLRLCGNYGAFCLGHGVFICLILAPEPPPTAFPFFYGFVAAYEAVRGPMAWTLLWLALGQGYDALRPRPGERLSAEEEAARPYARLIVLHTAIVLGGFLADLVGSPVFVLLVLIVLKALIERATYRVRVG